MSDQANILSKIDEVAASAPGPRWQVIVAAHAEQGPPLILMVTGRERAKMLEALDTTKDFFVQLSAQLRARGHHVEVRFAQTKVG